MLIERFQVHPKLRDPLTPFRFRGQRVGLDNPKKNTKWPKMLSKVDPPSLFARKFSDFRSSCDLHSTAEDLKLNFSDHFGGFPKPIWSLWFAQIFGCGPNKKFLNKRGWLNFLCFFRICFYVRTTRGWDNFQKQAERKPLFLLPQIRKSGVISDSFYLHRIQKQTATNPFSPTPKKKGTWLNDMSDWEHQLKAMSLTSISNAFFLLLYEHLFF